MTSPALVPRSGHPKGVEEVVQHDEKEVEEQLPEEFEGEEERDGDDIVANADVEAGDTLESHDEAVELFAPDLDDSLRAIGPSEEEENAARKIQEVYRRYARYRSSRVVNAEIDAIFKACLKETQSPEWCRDRYSLFFLGPLPHLLVCLERGITRTHAVKAMAKKLFNEVSHERLEEVGKQRSEIMSVNSLDIVHRLTIIPVLQNAPQEGREVAQAVRTLFTNTSPCPRYQCPHTCGRRGQGVHAECSRKHARCAVRVPNGL